MSDVAIPGVGRRETALVRAAISAALGVGFTWIIFQGVGRFLHPRESAPEAAVEELHEVFLPAPPPPPPAPVTTDVAGGDDVPGFELAPSDSPVRIAVSPPAFETRAPSETTVPAQIRIGSYAPKGELTYDPNHVYQLSEVDRRPTVVYRTNPVIPDRVRDGAPSLRAVFVFVVDGQGGVGDVRVLHPSGNAEFDQIVGETIREWSFSPAMRKGKPVRCLMEEAVTVRWSSGSKFSL